MNRVDPVRNLGKSLGKIFEIAGWMAGTAMITFYASARFVGEAEREQGIEAFAQARVPLVISTPNFVTPAAFAWDDFPPLAIHSQPISFSQEQMTFPTDGSLESFQPVTTSGSLPIALLTINSVGLEVPVFENTSERNLNRGAGWVEGTAAPDDVGNIAIAAHRDGYFRVLKDVALGDILVLESLTRKKSYRVAEIMIVEPDDTSSLLETETAAVTLVTCYPFYFVGHAPQRYIVRAVAL
jgi:LPXTG-site transpeptidase (sortase) family protein